MAAPDRDDDLHAGIIWYFTTGSDTPCPGEETLAEYLQGTLQGRGREACERHLALCDRCARTVCAAAAQREEPGAAGTVTVPEPVLERLRGYIPRHQPSASGRVWRRLLHQAGRVSSRVDSLVSFGRPGLVYVRGRKKVISKNLVAVEKVFSSVKLSIEVEKTGAQRADIRIIATRPRTGARFHGVRVDLCAGRKELASFVAVRGEVLFEHVAFGGYRVVAWDAGRKLGEVRLSIKE